MSPAVISFLFTVGASAWVYTKLQRYSGNNTKQSLIAAAAIALIIFFVFFSILSLVLK